MQKNEKSSVTEKQKSYFKITVLFNDLEDSNLFFPKIKKYCEENGIRMHYLRGVV